MAVEQKVLSSRYSLTITQHGKGESGIRMEKFVDPKRGIEGRTAVW